MLKKEYEIFAQFVKFPWQRFTFKEIKKLSGKKSDGYVYDALKRFVVSGSLKEEKAGNVVLYSLNIESLRTQSYAGFIAEHMAWNEKHIPYRDLEKIASKIPTDFYIFIITGSYAKNCQKKGSDIDIVIIVDDNTEPKRVYSELKYACEMNIPPIHLYVFKRSEMLTMLLDKKANYGTEIARNNLILSGGENYFKIMSEAMKNGFNG